MKSMIKAIIWDLDDTLLDTTRILIPIARTPAFEKRIREPLPLLEGAAENLQHLSRKYLCFLLTYGRVDAQKAKLESLGIEPFFKACYFVDPARQEVKGQYFRRIPADWGLQPGECLSIGNRRSTDIGEAKKEGLRTCLFRYGEHLDEPPSCPEDEPDFEFARHAELIATCRL